MIVFAVFSFGVIISLCYLIYDLSNKIVKEREDFDKQRQVLLNRIQDPSYKPPHKVDMTPAEKREYLTRIAQSREEAEQLGLVGTIQE